jgi:hypothetical protein
VKQSNFRNFRLYKTRTKYPCRKCSCTYKVVGDTWLETKRATKAVDGTDAHRIYWVCHSGHQIFRGYSRPVSWKKNLGGDKVIDENGNSQTYAEEETEIENEYQEMLAYAKKKMNSSTGKTMF